ncbi:hypothetical protein WA588_003389, partial [Blastocystis sp. NMH]
MSALDASFFKPLGKQGPPGASNGKRVSGAETKEKMEEMKKIDEYLGEKDLIDLSTLSSSSVQMKKKEPATPQEDAEKKQQSMISTLDQKKKELQKKKETIERINRELQLLDAPVSKEIATLRTKLEHYDRELAKATKVRKQKEQELLAAIDVVSRLADEKSTVSEKLQMIMVDAEAAKQKKLKELEEQMREVGV